MLGHRATAKQVCMSPMGNILLSPVLLGADRSPRECEYRVRTCCATCV